MLDFSATDYPLVLERSLNSMTDLLYLLTVVPKASEWDVELRTFVCAMFCL